MKKICLFILLTMVMHNFAMEQNDKTGLPTVDRAKGFVSQNSISIKEELSWGSLSGVMGYLGYRAVKKCGYELPLPWDSLNIGVSLTAGIIGMGLIDYAYRASHCTHAMIAKENYVTGLEEDDDEEENPLSFYIDKSKNSQTSLYTLCKNLQYLNNRNEPLNEFKGKEIEGNIDRTLWSGISGMALAGVSIASNPIGFKAALSFLPDAHPWALGIFSFGINMLAIKTLYAIGARIFFPDQKPLQTINKK